MDANRDSHRKKGRTTKIIDDDTALAMAEAQAQQGGRRGGGTRRPNPPMTKNAGISKSTPKTAFKNPGTPATKPETGKNNRPKLTDGPTSSAAPEAREYRGDGLCIPLFDKKNKKKTHARSVHFLAQKYPKVVLLATVEDYAGVAKMQEFESAQKSKREIAEWIEAAETKAFGSEPKRHVAPEQRQTDPDILSTRVQHLKATAASDVKKPDSHQKTSSHQTVLKGKRKSTHDSSVIDGEQTRKKKKKKVDQPQLVAGPAASPSPKQLALSSESSAPDDLLQSRTKPQAAKVPTKGTVAKDGGFKLYIPTIIDIPWDGRHPLIDALGLDPQSSSTCVFDLPDSKALVTAGSKTAVHVTEISHEILREYERSTTKRIQARQSLPEEKPSLKTGPHGYDKIGRRWYWAGDPDLETGRGHQIDPVDAASLKSILLRVDKQSKLVLAISTAIEKLDAELGTQPAVDDLRAQKRKKDSQLEMETEKLKELRAEKFRSEKKYKDKYTGYLVSQWPCGCEKSGDKGPQDDDSEAE